MFILLHDYPTIKWYGLQSFFVEIVEFVETVIPRQATSGTQPGGRFFSF
jgi:hypothetical protein